MSGEKTFHVKLLGSDGGDYIIGYAALAKVLGLDELTQRVYQLEKPLRKQRILEAIKNSGKPRTDSWLYRHVQGFQHYPDLTELLDEGKLKRKRHGTQTVFEVVENR